MLVREQSLEDVDRRPERRHGRAVLDLAVPAAVGQLLAQESLDERRHLDAEVRAGRNDVAVDARLDLALEEALVLPRRVPPGAIAPGDMLANAADRPLGLLAPGIEPQPPQELQDMERVRSILREGVAGPQAVRRLEGEQSGAPALGRDLARSAATTLAGSCVRSRIACQRIAGSESSSQSVTDMTGFCSRQATCAPTAIRSSSEAPSAQASTRSATTKPIDS